MLHRLHAARLPRIMLGMASPGSRIGPAGRQALRCWASAAPGPALMDKILCLGKNYAEHARELGDEVPDKPVLFLKPPSAALFVEAQGGRARATLPKGRGNVHYETEILLRLGAGGEVDAVSLGLDLTLRQLQASLKQKGHPWEIAKVFRDAAVIGPWLPLAAFPDYLEREFTLTLDGEERQRGRGADMLMGPAAALGYLAQHFPLRPGDVIMTGTPAGVGELRPGQRAELAWGDKLRYSVDFQ